METQKSQTVMLFWWSKKHLGFRLFSEARREEDPAWCVSNGPGYVTDPLLLYAINIAVGNIQYVTIDILVSEQEETKTTH